MAISDLVVNSEQISSDIVEKVLKGHVDLVSGRKVALSSKTMKMPNREQVLFFLCGGHAWELIDTEQGEPVKEWSRTPGEMEKTLGIKGNSLRPVLKSLADSYFVIPEKGKYKISPRGINYLKDFLAGDTSDKPKKITKFRPNKKSKKHTSSSKAGVITELGNSGFINAKSAEEIRTEMARKGFSAKSTSMPSLLLPFLQKGALDRKQRAVGKNKVWEYTWVKTAKQN